MIFFYKKLKKFDKFLKKYDIIFLDILKKECLNDNI